MALYTKRENVKQVPWFSPTEWHDVYRQIYSNDTAEQTKAYEVLLAWKARNPKLPVGVDCTLSILQVCLRDREWTSKIDSGELPMYYEKDLSLMYSTTIMRILNHISNVGAKKEASLFKLAKHLKIPIWIVHLRHEAAHGYELPCIGVLRIAVNILLEWLHDEYWVAEAQALEEYYAKENLEEAPVEEDLDEMQTFVDLIEVWSAVTLYIDTDHELVSTLPDKQLREILEDLRTYMLSKHNGKTLENDENEEDNENDCIITSRKTIKLLKKEYNLKAARALLLSEISVHLNGNESSNKSSVMHRKGNMICDVLCKNAAFLPNSDIMRIFQEEGKKIKSKSLKGKILPHHILQFWKDIIFLLHREGMLETLVFKLLDIVNQEQESKERRTSAALWIGSLAYSFIQLDIAQYISHTVEDTLTKVDTKSISQYVRKQLRCNYPYLENVLWLDITSTIPHFLTDINFLSRLLLHANEFSKKLIKPILTLVVPKIDAQLKKHMLHLLKSYTSLHIPKCNSENTDNGVCDKIYTVEDFQTDSIENEKEMHMRKNTSKRKKKRETHLLADQTIRNLHWKPALDAQWIDCPIGLLPWQTDSLKSLEPLKVNMPKHPISGLDSRITAGIINRKNLRMRSCIKWDNILWRKRKVMKKRNKTFTFSKAIIEKIIMDKTLETNNQT